MNILKSHFWYNKNQRNGILLLVAIIIIIQIGFVFLDDGASQNTINLHQPKFAAFLHQIDSLKQLELEKRKPKIYPFNPNYITDFKGAQLGMSLSLIHI